MLIEHESRFVRILRMQCRKVSPALLCISLSLGFSASLESQRGHAESSRPIPYPSDSAPMGPVSREAVSDTAFERDIRVMEARSRQMEMQDIRHKFQSDAGKLLSLATDLKAEIGKEGRDSLTPADTKKLAEIQKLAHRVKSKLRDYAIGY